MASFEVLSVDEVDAAAKTARVTLRIMIADEVFVQQILGVPTSSVSAAKTFLSSYAQEYEHGYRLAQEQERRREQAEDDDQPPPAPPTPSILDNLVGKEF